ncbi:Glia maturation factor gamma, partial [Eschrichtius robustus]|nr:Glia maturation factor gamma [Eschrichtius robustus]
MWDSLWNFRSNWGKLRGPGAPVVCRFVVYSYKYMHADGRVSYPLCFIFSSPVGCKPEQQMMYAGSKNRLVQTAELTKVFEIRTTDDLTEAWLQEKLSFFR